MMRRNDTVGLFFVAITILVLFYFLNSSYASGLGFDSSIATNLGAVFPGLFITILSLIAISRGSALAIGGFGAAGIGFAILLGELYTVGTIDDTILSGATLAQVQTLTIVIGIVMGGVSYAVSHHD